MSSPQSTVAGFGPTFASPAPEHPPSMPEQRGRRSVMLVRSIWGFLERELIGKANTPWPDAGTGMKLKPSPPAILLECWQGGFLYPRISPGAVVGMQG